MTLMTRSIVLCYSEVDAPSFTLQRQLFCEFTLQLSCFKHKHSWDTVSFLVWRLSQKHVISRVWLVLDENKLKYVAILYRTVGQRLHPSFLEKLPPTHPPLESASNDCLMGHFVQDVCVCCQYELQRGSTVFLILLRFTLY